MIRSYVRDRHARKLQEITDKIDKFEADIQEHVQDVERVRAEIALINKEIDEGGAVQANIRDNLFMRELVRSINQTQKEIDALDMEEAAKARRNFDEQYPKQLERETNMQSNVLICHPGPCWSTLMSSLVCTCWRADPGFEESAQTA